MNHGFLLTAKGLFLNLDLLTANPSTGLNNKGGLMAQGGCESVSGPLTEPASPYTLFFLQWCHRRTILGSLNKLSVTSFSYIVWNNQIINNLERTFSTIKNLLWNEKIPWMLNGLYGTIKNICSLLILNYILSFFFMLCNAFFHDILVISIHHLSLVS